MTDEHPNPIAPEPEADPGADLAAEATPAASSASTGSAGPRRAVSSAATPPPRRPDYRGEELDPERGPGLGCFWFQVIVLGFFIVLIPIGLELSWPFELLAFLLFVVIGLLLLTGQSVIFLLRLVAADRRSQGRRRPLASSTKTVGELEDEMDPAAEPEPAEPAAEPAAAPEPAEPAEPAVADQVVDSASIIRAREPSEPTADARSGPGGAATTDAPIEGDPGPVAADAADAAEPPAGDTSGDDLGGPAQESSTESRRTGRGRRRAGLPGAAADPAAADPAAAEPAAASEPARPEEPDPGVRQ